MPEPHGTGRESAPSGAVSVGDAAERVGVSTSTLRAWERRYGLGPTERTDGGHRRYTAADVAALLRLRRLVAAGMATGSAAAVLAGGRQGHAHGRPLSPPDRGDQLALGFAAAVEALDARAAAVAADRIVSRRGAVPAWVEVFVPHLQGLGEAWALAETSVEREHLASAAIHSALARHALIRRPMRQSTSAAQRAQVLAAATPGEQHTLPLHALAAALAEAGVDSCVLGALPALALHTAVQDTAPAVIVLWAQSDQTSAPGLLHDLIDTVPVVCAAGPGWDLTGLPARVTHLADLPTAVQTVLAWTAVPTPP